MIWFSCLWVASAALVILSSNPLFSVLFLIIAFFNASALVLLSGHDYLAALFVVLYAGAMCTFFLFVLMILDIKVATKKEERYKQLPLNILVSLSFGFCSVQVLDLWDAILNKGLKIRPLTLDIVDSTTQIYNLGVVLYTDYALALLIAGLLLLGAMLGSVALTLKKSKIGGNRTNVSVQNMREWKSSIWNNR